MRFVVKMAASGCHLTQVFVLLRSVLLLFILPVCNFVPWLLVDGYVGTAAVGIQSYESDFQTFRAKYSFSVLNNIAVVPEPMDPTCQALINNFSDSSVLYTRCIIQNAKTYKRCQRCVDDYLAVDTSYHLLKQVQHNNSTPKRCTEIYPGMDEVDVFSSVFKFVQESWNAGGCQNCFSWFDINAKNVGKLTKTAQTFLNMSELFLICIFNESIEYKLQKDMSSNLLQNHARNDSNITICTRCKGAYKRLNDFYVSNFETIFDKAANICVDISDLEKRPPFSEHPELGVELSMYLIGKHLLSKRDPLHHSTTLLVDHVTVQLNSSQNKINLMNFTRYMWQEIYECPIQHASAWPVIVASVVMCCLPVGLYVATKIFGHDVERKMVHQKRLRRRSGGSSATFVSTSSDIGNHQPM